MHDCFDAITLALLLYVYIPFALALGYYGIKMRRQQRRDRALLDDLIKTEKIKIDQLTANRDPE